MSNDEIEQLIADVANETTETDRPYQAGEYALTKQDWSVREVVKAMIRLNKIK